MRAALLATMFASVVVMELFTSQGCSSCPPADRLLSRIGSEQFDGAVVIPLAFHVDYWNSIGWVDPFSSPLWSQRQHAYAAAFNSSQVYTPQLVLNGSAQMVGSNERAIRGEIEKQSKSAAHGRIAIIGLTAQELEIEAALDASAGDSVVNVVVFENGVTTAVKRGENAGKNLTNDYIVRSITPAFPIKRGETVRRKVTVPIAANESLAVFIQDRRTLAIYAGASK